jgi:hypothetical protein
MLNPKKTKLSIFKFSITLMEKKIVDKIKKAQIMSFFVVDACKRTEGIVMVKNMIISLFVNEILNFFNIRLMQIKQKTKKSSSILFDK